MFPLYFFADPSLIMKKIKEEIIKIDLLVQDLSPEKQVKMIVNHNDGTSDEIMLNHNF